MTFFVIILSHLRTHSLKNYSLIFLHVFILKFSIISPMDTPRMKNQSILSTLPLLHFTPTFQLIFLKYFYIFFISYASPNFTTRTGTGRYKKAAGRERPTTCTCPWQVILSPKSPRFWQGLLPAPSI